MSKTENQKKIKLTEKQVEVLAHLPFSFRHGVYARELPVACAGPALNGLERRRLASANHRFGYGEKAWSASVSGNAVILTAHPHRRLEYYQQLLKDAEEDRGQIEKRLSKAQAKLEEQRSNLKKVDKIVRRFQECIEDVRRNEEAGN